MAQPGLDVLARLAIEAMAAVATGPLGPLDLPAVDLEAALRGAGPAAEVRLLDRRGEDLGLLPPPARAAPPLGDVPAAFVEALVVMEDRRFGEHAGVDPLAVAAALADGIAGRPRGGSTLAQQAVKNAVTGPEPSLRRKAIEAILAVRATAGLPPERILEAHLANAWFGRGPVGGAGAARAWFGKPWSELDLAQSALLAGLLQSPGRLDPIRHPERARARRDAVLARLAEAGAIAETARAAAAARDPAAGAVAPGPALPGAVEDPWLAAAARRALGVPGDPGGLVAETGFDRRWQALAARTLDAELVRLSGSRPDLGGAAPGEAAGPALQGAIVVLDLETGDLLASAGGAEAGPRIDRTRALRQPGSTVKPFLWLAALDAGMSPSDPALDLRMTHLLPDGRLWSPRNHDGAETGIVPLWRALEESSNLVAAQLVMDLGAERFAAVAEAAGLHAPGAMPRVPAAALGTVETDAVALAGAYAAFAGAGEALRPRVLRAVLRDGRRTPAPAAERRRIGSPGAAEAVLSMLAGASLRGTAAGAFADAVPIPGKTGTSDGSRDAVFAGFGPDLVVVVRIGRDDGRPWPGLSGATAAAPAARRLFEAARREGLLDAEDRRPEARLARPWPPRPFETFEMAPAAPLPDDPAPAAGMSPAAAAEDGPAMRMLRDVWEVDRGRAAPRRSPW